MNRFLFAVLCLSLVAGCAMHRVPMQRDDFGLHFVRMRVNGHAGIFLVDSGASHTVLDYQFARRSLGGLSASNLRLAWLGSRNAEAYEGIANEIQIGNYRQRGQFRLHVLNLDAINNAPARLRTMRMDGILGADFFINHRALIDYSQSALTFGSAPNTWALAPTIRPR